MLKGDKADSSTLSHRTLANDFRKEIRSQAKTGGKGFKPGAFRPTYGLDPSQLDQLDEASGDALNEKGQNKSRKGGRKRPRKSTTIEGS